MESSITLLHNQKVLVGILFTHHELDDFINVTYEPEPIPIEMFENTAYSIYHSKNCQEIRHRYKRFESLSRNHKVYSEFRVRSNAKIL